MKKNKVIYGVLGVLVGYIILALTIDAISKPDNFAVSLKPIDSLKTYFFTFVYGMGEIGWLVGSLLLLGWVILFYFLGIWLAKIIFNFKM